MYLKPYAFVKTVTLTTAREQLTTSDIKVPAVVITAERSNTGVIYIGDNQVSSTRYGADLSAGDSIKMSSLDYGGTKVPISLRDIWLVPSVATDGVSVMYLEGVK